MENKTISVRLSKNNNKELVAEFKEKVKLSPERVILAPITSANADFQVFYGNTIDPRALIGTVEKGQLTDEEKAIINANKYTATAVEVAGVLLKVEIEESENIELPQTAEENANSERKTQALERAKNILGEDEADKRIKYLKKNDIDEDDLLFAPSLELILAQPEPIPEPKKLYIKEKGAKESLIKKILRNTVLGDAVILEGPKSVGKNVAWESIGWLLNRPMEVLNCSKKMTKADIFGSLSTDAEQKNDLTVEGAMALLRAFSTEEMEVYERQKLVDKASEFLVAMAKSSSADVKLQFGPVTRALINAHDHGTILIIDELNLSEPNLFAGTFNALTDKHTTNYQINGLGQVKIPKKLIIGGTQNGGVGYLGTEKQNSATMSRFNVIRLTTTGDITKVLVAHAKAENLNVDMEIIENLNKIYREFVNVSKGKGASGEEPLNVRGFERALGHIAFGQSIGEAVKECVVNSCDARLEKDLTIGIDNIVGRE